MRSAAPRGRRRMRRAAMTPRNRWLTAYALVVYAFLFAPIVVLIIFSFNNVAPELRTGRASRSTGTRRLFANRDLLDALLGDAAASPSSRSSCRRSSGPLLGLALARLRFRGRGAAETLLLLPMVTPEIVMGLSLLVFFFQLFDARGSFAPARRRAHHVLHQRTWRSSSARGRRAMNPQLEEAARDLGRVRVRRVPLRDAAAHPAGGHRRARCSRSRCRSTTTS